MSEWPQFERVLVIPVDKLDRWLAQLTPTPELLADLNQLLRDASYEIGYAQARAVKFSGNLAWE